MSEIKWKKWEWTEFGNIDGYPKSGYYMVTYQVWNPYKKEYSKRFCQEIYFNAEEKRWQYNDECSVDFEEDHKILFYAKISPCDLEY